MAPANQGRLVLMRRRRRDGGPRWVADRRGGNPPDGVSDVVSDEEGAAPIERHAHRPAERLTVLADESGQHVDRITGRHAGAEGHEDHLVATPRLAIPLLNAELKDLAIPVHDAAFSKSGDPRYFWTEHVETHDGEISLTWYDIGEGLLIHTEPNQQPNPRPYRVCTVLVPALGTRLMVNGQQARGKSWARQREGRPFSTSALAFSESWTEPR